MEWIVLAMVLVPLLVFGGGGVWWLSEQARRNRLLGGDPEVARLAARADAAVSRLTAGPGVSALPPALAEEVRARASELVHKVLPGLLDRRRDLVARIGRAELASLESDVARYEREMAAATDSETRRLLETNLSLARERLASAAGLKDELRRIDLSIQALVSNVEALEERFAAGSTALPGAQKLESANRLLEELKHVQQELRALETATSPLLPEPDEPTRKKVRS